VVRKHGQYIVFLILYLCKIQFMASDSEKRYLLPILKAKFGFFHLPKCLYEQEIHRRQHMKYIYDISVFRENIVFSTSKRPNKRMPIRPGCIKGIKRKKKRYQDTQFTERSPILHVYTPCTIL